jgi:hypothetical protein
MKNSVNTQFFIGKIELEDDEVKFLMDFAKKDRKVQDR